VRAMWNSILAAVVFQHESIESLRRELSRNAQLRQVCGFDLFKSLDAVAGPHVYTRFLSGLMKRQEQIDRMFDEMVEELREHLEGFGQALAVDGKAIATHAQAPKKDAPARDPDGRRDVDADWGKKTSRVKRKDGSVFEKVRSWFGYKLHLIVDANHEIPVAYEVTRASAGEQPVGRNLVGRLGERHPEILDACEQFLADKGYDDTKLIETVWDEHEIKPVIAIRNCWQDGEETKLVPGQHRAVYDYQGQVYCHCPCTGQRRKMAYGGFEQARGTLKYRCPAAHYGQSCKGSDRCEIKGSIRIKLAADRRVFTPLARSSYAWERAYRKRTSVERVNSRLDVSFGFEHHFIRGLAKMRLRCGLALLVMVAMALGHAKAKRTKLVRSLIRTA